MAAESSKEVAQIMRSGAYRKIKKSLLEQLARSGNDDPHFSDMVEDYMKMYVTKELCNRDIEQRGVNVTSIGSKGQTVVHKNDSVDMMLKTNAQMLKLLDALGVKPDAVVEDDEELL